MKRIKNVSIYLFVAISIVLSSCNSDQLEISNTSISSKNAIEIYKIPFAEQQTLTDIASNKSNISYQTARKMAIIEMELSLKAQMKWSGAKLSEKPVVVYDAKSNAKYYEFIVISDAGQNIGTVTTCVQKETDAVISHVLPYVRDYSCFTTKGSSYKMISTGYPSRILIGVLAKSGDEPSVVIDPATNNSVSNLLTEDASGAIESINKLTEDQKTGFGITNADSLVNAIKEKDALNKMYAHAVICLVNNFAHYVVAFGSKYENWNWDVFVKILGKKVTISKGSIRTNKWLYVTDNGHTTSGSSYEPFWRNDNFFSLDLQYGVYKLY